MRLAVTQGTMAEPLKIYGETAPTIDVPPDIAVAGKTGTAEFCDAFAYPRGWCIVGNFPTHAWTALYAPADKPEIAVIIFVYHGGEGSKMAAPIGAKIIKTYFELKEIDSGGK
jgi:penicillin-binding protein 2